jgi:hypothetical protein
MAASHCQKALNLARKMDIKKALIFSLLMSGRIWQEKQERVQARDYSNPLDNPILLLWLVFYMRGNVPHVAKAIIHTR